MSKLSSRLKESRLYPALLLEDLISRRARRVLWRAGQLLLLILFLLLARAWWFSLTINLSRWIGAVLVCLAFTLMIYLVECFFRSFYYSSILTNDYQPEDLFTFTVGRILYRLKNEDVWRGFLLSDTGSLIMKRLGLERRQIDNFLGRRQTPRAALELSGTRPLTLAGLVDWLYAADESFAKFLFSFNIRAPELQAAAAWVVRDIETKAARERWWSRQYLEGIAGLAKDWSYGGTPTLDRYSEDLLATPQASDFSRAVAARGEEARKLEAILLRSREANALLVGGPGESKLDTVWQLVSDIKLGRVAPALEHRRPALFHTAMFLAACRERGTLEQELLKVFTEAYRAGNLILVIDNLPNLLAGAARLGTNLVSLLDRFLISPDLPIVALADNDVFHRELETREDLLRRFEKLAVSDLDQSRLVALLEIKTSELEASAPVFFTYQALTTFAAAAEKYFPLENTADQAIDLLTEVVPWVAAQREPLVDRDLALEFIREKTGIPLGPIGRSEQTKLLALEEELRKQIVGQEEAVVGISRALRRSRAGVRNEKRPIGSFLFLGPTGVGKTETAKALARVLFGREEAMMRLDMSEYQSAEALSRLIGSFTTGEPGILANLLRQNFYGVLLLDEFEKTNQDVLNLFLQILDEGYFSDMLGRRVNARNIVFIATSNAAAEFVWTMVKSGRDPTSGRRELINQIIERGIFRPELLNRFDEVIIFRPLGTEELRAVAKLQLGRLAVRLREQGIELKVTDQLINEVVSRGSDPVFGARPMARYIQSHIEQLVADGIVSGRLSPGAAVAVAQGRLILGAAS